MASAFLLKCLFFPHIAFSVLRACYTFVCYGRLWPCTLLSVLRIDHATRDKSWPQPDSNLPHPLRHFLQSTLQEVEARRWSADRLLSHPYLRDSFPLRKYKRGDRLGSGTFGEVYAYQLLSSHDDGIELARVAVKELSG